MAYLAMVSYIEADMIGLLFLAGIGCSWAFGLWRCFRLRGHRMTVANRHNAMTLSKGLIGRTGTSTEPCSALRTPPLDACPGRTVNVLGLSANDRLTTRLDGVSRPE